MEKREDLAQLRSVRYGMIGTKDGSDHVHHVSQLLRREYDSIALPLPSKEIDVPIFLTEKMPHQSFNLVISPKSAETLPRISLVSLAELDAIEGRC
ncbi:hypothetical protein NPIL_435931 [Nephila pilipes]|uniref:Uncharacterized protein n=1 Tax=Nephila pilipes TaxID=299642 RepID=A0A8X6QL87_NEPPI|nr:hypothetical protein NPIL_435931 [Nephila pilipes]